MPPSAVASPARRRAPRRLAVGGALLACLALLVALLTSRGGDTPGADGVPDPVPAGGPEGVSWQLELDEDFSGDLATLQDSGTWHTGWFGDGQLTLPVNDLETALMSSANLSVADGLARLDVTPNPDGLALGDGTTYPNLGAALNSDWTQAPEGFAITYGYVEARMQLPAGDPDEEVWPAFWLNGQTWPDDLEVDVVEGDGTDEGCKFNIHYGTDDDTINLNDAPRTSTVRGATTGMHTYAADIRPDGVTFYYDGVAVGGWEGEVPDVPRYLMVGVTSSGIMDSTRSLLVDHVRAWTRA